MKSSESLSMPRPLDGRIALLTGASRGIGRAVALEFARASTHVTALARTQGALEALDDTIRRQGNEATLVPCDLKDFDAFDHLGAAIFERWASSMVLSACGSARPGDAARPCRTQNDKLYDFPANRVLNVMPPS